jgi:apolipoprotein D and lipocalin family protein
MKILPALLALTAFAASTEALAATAPQPVGEVDIDLFYKGAWREIARTPTKPTAGCVAPETLFGRDDTGGIIDRESCRMGDPISGETRSVIGSVKILNPGPNTKFQITYEGGKGPFKARNEYWVLDHGQNWFIAANPSFTRASIFSRASQPGQQTKDLLAGRLKSLGYDITKLEWPAQPPE